MKTGEFGKALGGDRRERCVVVVELFWEVFRVGVQVFGHLLHVGPSKEAPQRARFRLGSKHKVHGEIRQAEAGFFRDTGTFLMRAGRSPHRSERRCDQAAPDRAGEQQRSCSFGECHALFARASVPLSGAGMPRVDHVGHLL